MKLKITLLVCLFAISACMAPGAGQAANLPQLTPFLTSTTAVKPTVAATSAPQPTTTPEPTATPLIHVLALGETISSIALRYGLDMGTVLAANPGLNPNALIVGTEVIVPVGGSVPQIGMVSEPLEVKLGSPECIPTFEKGLWCFIEVENTLEQASTMVVVMVSLEQPGGNQNRQMNVPLLLHKIEPGQTIPVVAYFAPPIPDGVKATAELISALPLSESKRSFLPAAIVNDKVDLFGRTALVSGEVEINGEPGESVTMRVAAMAYDANGRLVGARRMEREIILEPGDAADFFVHLYSFGGPIDNVIIYAEATIDNS
jgi:LysM repeat protein